MDLFLLGFKVKARLISCGSGDSLAAPGRPGLESAAPSAQPFLTFPSTETEMFSVLL